MNEHDQMIAEIESLRLTNQRLEAEVEHWKSQANLANVRLHQNDELGDYQHTKIKELEAEVERMKERESPNNRRNAAWYWFERAAVEWLGMTKKLAHAAFEMRWDGALRSLESRGEQKGEK